MNPLDIALIALLVLPALLGLWKGLANIVTVLVGLWSAFLLAPLVKEALAPKLTGVGSPELAAVLAYGLGFLGVLLVVGLLGWLVTRSLKKLDLQWANRLAGGALGLACGLLIGGVLIATIEALNPGTEVVRSSVLGPPLGKATRFLVAMGPVDVPAAVVPVAPSQPPHAPDGAEAAPDGEDSKPEETEGSGQQG